MSNWNFGPLKRLVGIYLISMSTREGQGTTLVAVKLKLFFQSPHQQPINVEN